MNGFNEEPEQQTMKFQLNRLASMKEELGLLLQEDDAKLRKLIDDNIFSRIQKVLPYDEKICFSRYDWKKGQLGVEFISNYFDVTAIPEVKNAIESIKSDYGIEIVPLE